MKYYIDVIVPLPLDNIFTYQVNLKEFEFIKDLYSPQSQAMAKLIDELRVTHAIE